MKTKAMVAVMLAALATTGTQCINDNFLIAVNLPIPFCHSINPGPNTFSGRDTIKLEGQIDKNYVDNMKAARFYDIKVSVGGDYNGSGTGDAFIVVKDTLFRIVHFSGNWSDFKTPVSVLTGAPKVVIDTTGVKKLVDILNQFVMTRSASVILEGRGTLSGQTPVPSGLSACIEVFAQVDAQIK
jgi:hypothetical protein